MFFDLFFPLVCSWFAFKARFLGRLRGLGETSHTVSIEVSIKVSTKVVCEVSGGPRIAAGISKFLAGISKFLAGIFEFLAGIWSVLEVER